MLTYKKPPNWSEQQYQLAIRIYTLSMWMMEQKIWHEYCSMHTEGMVRLLVRSIINDKILAIPLSYRDNIPDIQQQIQAFLNETPQIINIQAYDVVSGNTIFTLKVGDKYEAMGK